MNSEASGRRTLPALLALGTLAIALLAAGCGGSDAGNPDSRLSLEQAQEPLKGAPPPLAEIRTQANELLGGGTDAFDTRLGALRGYPVVVNKWASWCGPCRFEFPYFQSVAAERGGEIAFLGVDSNDSDSAAEQFLSELPLPFPSYSDPNLEIAQQFDGPPQAFPATAFYDRSGKLVYTHLGPYRGEEDLIADVNRYAG